VAIGIAVPRYRLYDIAGSAVLLLAHHLISSRGNTGCSRRRPSWGAPVNGLT
jgi:hypothetical protein